MPKHIRVTPSWVHGLIVIAPDDYDPVTDHHAVAVVVAMGHGKQVSAWGYSALFLAFLFEWTRIPGNTVTVNHNGKGRKYPRLTITGHPEHLTTISRLIMDAGSFDEVQFGGPIKGDMRPENLAKVATWRNNIKGSRIVLRSLGEKLAGEWATSGRMPPHITAASYLENLEALLDAFDAATLDYLAQGSYQLAEENRSTEVL